MGKKAPPKPLPKPPIPAPTPTDKKSKFRQDNEADKPSEKLRQKPGTSGQVDPRLKNEKKPLTAKEKSAAKENRQLDKSKLRAEKSGNKLNKARKKLSKQKPRKPPGVGKQISRAVGYEVAVKIHGKINEVERDNVGIEAAHKAEVFGERTGRFAVRHVKNRIRTRPARRVKKAVRKNIRANVDYRFREMAKETPELKKNALKRHLHKKRIQKQFRKQATEATKKGAVASKKTVSVVEKTSRAVVNFIRKNPKVMLIIAICFLIIVIVQSCTAMTLTLFNGLSGVVGATSYLAEDEDIDEVELRYGEWEIDLLLEAQNAEITHDGYDEYRYYLDTPGHDPYALLAYLTAMYNDFTFASVHSELQDIFNQQYTLTFDPSVEIRTCTETRTGRIRWTDEDGNTHTETYTYEVEVEYEWHILTVTLTAGSFTDIIMPLFTTQEEQERYALLMITKGNRQYVGNPLGYYWLPYVSSNYGYRIHPISGEKDYHTGVDIALPEGTPLMAGGAGTVLASGDNGGYGLSILIDYGNGVQARYAHCSRLNYTVGQTVQAGDIIALSGNTGNSTGPHLHMEVIKNGRYLNPFFFVDGTVDY